MLHSIIIGAWQTTFGTSSKTKKLLCRWHLDKSWRQTKLKINNFKQRCIIILLNESTLVEFNKKLQQFLTDSGMYEFLRENYCSRIDRSVGYSCQAVHSCQHEYVCGIIPPTCKEVYFQQKQNRIVDALLIKCFIEITLLKDLKN